MTTDLGGLFRSVQAASGTWSHDDVRQTLQALAGTESRIDWEPGDEEWGRIIATGGDVLALVCARVPVGIVHESVEPGRLPQRVTWLTVRSMSHREFEVDRRLLEAVFRRSLSDSIDYSNLSIDDLWWATVS